MRRAGLFLLVLTVIGAACGLPLVDGTVVISGICAVVPDVQEPAAGPGGTQTVTTKFGMDAGTAFSALTSNKNAKATDLEVTSITLGLGPDSGVPDFGFVDSASMALYTDPTQPPTPAFSYTKDPSAPPPSSIDMKPVGTINLINLLTQGNPVEAEVQFQGTLPQTAWSITVEPCFTAKGAVKY